MLNEIIIIIIIIITIIIFNDYAILKFWMLADLRSPRCYKLKKLAPLSHPILRHRVDSVGVRSVAIFTYILVF